MSCPNCKSEIELSEGLSESIVQELAPLIDLKERVESEALVNAEE